MGENLEMDLMNNSFSESSWPVHEELDEGVPVPEKEQQDEDQQCTSQKASKFHGQSRG